MKYTAILALFAIAVTTAVHAADNLKSFPPAGDGMTRFVINLPKERDEAAFKVELLVGKTVRTDVEVRYRIWRALPTAQKAAPG